MTMDPVTLAVVRGSLEQIADEMDLHLIHAAISPIISETNDCANGIFHPTTGETIAQGRYGLPVFLAYMQFSVQHIIGLANAQGGFKDGDIWIMNDTYLGGSHLQDVQLVAPIFVAGELFAVLATTGHWMDIGGNVPGGWGPKATEIHQEGIVIPPVKLYEQGRLNEALLAMFKANVRLPMEIAGDLSAMVNVFSVGHRGVEALVQRYGAPVLSDCLNEMIAYSERQMRSYISEIPDGTYRCEDFLDNDGIVDQAVPVKLAITVKGDEMHFDFTGTGPSTTGPMNMSRNTTLSSCYVAIKHIFPDVPVNGGTFRPISPVPHGVRRLLGAHGPRHRRDLWGLGPSHSRQGASGFLWHHWRGGHQRHPPAQQELLRGCVPLPRWLWGQPRQRWFDQRHTPAVHGQLHVAGNVRAPFPGAL
jgi:N-methylhydantoinase B